MNINNKIDLFHIIITINVYFVTICVYKYLHYCNFNHFTSPYFLLKRLFYTFLWFFILYDLQYTFFYL